nr:hypothetical protein [Paenibacillus sp.]
MIVFKKFRAIALGISFFRIWFQPGLGFNQALNKWRFEEAFKGSSSTRGNDLVSAGGAYFKAR